jgi:hypothetical protein
MRETERRIEQGCQMVAYIFEALGMENVGTFYGSLENIPAIWYTHCRYVHLVILLSFGVFSSTMVYCIKKIWQPRF